MHSALLLASLIGLSAAHFELKAPPSIGFEDKNEDKAPCGGFTPDFSGELYDWHVGGEAIAVRLTHQQSNWLFRVTTDEKAESGWEQIFPIVQQSGLGDFCQPQVTIPESYVGKKGVVSVVSSAVDGLLFQCVAANFIAGSAEPTSECKNASSVKASFVDDAQLTALVGDTGDSKNDTGSSESSATTAAPAATSTSAAAASLQAWSTSGLGGILAVLSMTFLGGALMI